MDFSGRRAELKAQFIQNRGYWADFWDYLLALDPDYFEAYLLYSSIPWKHGVLSPKMKEFVYITIDVATTHMYELGLRIHIQNALKYGATKDELMEVIKVTSNLGVDTMTVGVPELVRALERSGKAAQIERTLSPLQAELKEEFTRLRGFWSPAWDDILAIDPAYFEAFLRLSGSSHKTKVLDEKTIALIHIAANASTTHLHKPSIETQMERALAHGATVAEIMEVLQLVSVLGLHSCTFGVPILADELAKAGQPLTSEG